MVKPRVPVIDSNNPIAKGLVLDAPFFEGGGLAPQDLISRRLGVITTATWKLGIVGSTINYAGGAGGDRIVFANRTISTQRSTESLFFLTAVDATARRIHDWTNFDTIQTTSTVIMTTGAWSTTAASASIPIPALNTWHHIVVTYDGSSASNLPQIYLNGVLQTPTASATAVGTLNTGAGDLYIGNRSGNDRTFSGQIAYFRRWNTILNSQQVKQLYTNPWQIYTRPKSDLK